MSNLIKAELFKLQRIVSFWVILGTVTALSALMHILILTDWWLMNDTVFDRVGLSELNALSTFTVPIFFNLIVSTLAGFFISSEFSGSGVIKNQVMSGNKRSHIFIAKYIVFSLGAFIAVVFIPLITGVSIATLMEGNILNLLHIVYLAKAFALFSVQFFGFTAMVMLLAIVTEDSGKTIIFSILITIVLFAVEKLSKPSFVELAYENSIFQQFHVVFNSSLTSAEMVKSVIIGVMTVLLVTFYSVFFFKRKEVK